MNDQTIPPLSGQQDAAARNFIVDRFLLHHMLRMSRQTKGDFESMLIWSVLDLQRAAALVTSDLSAGTLSPGDLLPQRMLQQRGLRSSELAQITGVPRETVRRKLERLLTAGKVRRQEDGRWLAADASAKVAGNSFARETASNFDATADQLDQRR